MTAITLVPNAIYEVVLLAKENGENGRVALFRHIRGRYIESFRLEDMGKGIQIKLVV